MFEKKYEDRLRCWNQFRLSLETSPSPEQDVADLYLKAPKVSIQVDPWDQTTWLNPWELLKENQYCEFSKILGICYTLQLTNRFMEERPEIHIYMSSEKSKTYYLLFFQNKVFGYDESRVISRGDLPGDLKSLKIYSMPRLT